jgi:hypothetical protein
VEHGRQILPEEALQRLVVWLKEGEG